MTLIRGLRWAGNGISNGRQRLVQTSISSRQYSIQTYSSFNRRAPGARPLQPGSSYISQQNRSISLFGWGGSSKSTPEGLSPSEPSQRVGSSSIENDTITSGRTIRATHGTSESPDASQLESHPPTSFEPEPLEQLQQLITEPHSTVLPSEGTNIADAPERIGYLREVCGLDFGWGPSTCMEWVLEHLHISAGLSWSAAIIAMAFALRSAMLPALISSAKQQKKMREANPIVAPLREQYRDALVTGDKAKAQELQLQIKHIHKEFDINIMKAFVPMIIQIPFGYGAWRVLRNCGSLPVPGFVTEAWLWTSDLSFSDPYLLCPALSSAMVWYTLRMNMAASAGTTNQSFMQLFSSLFPAITFVFMLFQPGSVQLYFLSSTFCGLLSARLMQSQSFRNFFSLGPLPNSPAGRALAATTSSASRSSAVASAASATSASTSSYQTIAPATKLPGGLRRRHHASTQALTDETTTAAPDNRSVIDKGVDSFKGKWSEMKNSATKIQEETLGKMSTREDKARKGRLDKYEAEERARLDEERERRNQIRKNGRS